MYCTDAAKTPHPTAPPVGPHPFPAGVVQLKLPVFNGPDARRADVLLEVLIVVLDGEDAERQVHSYDAPRIPRPMPPQVRLHHVAHGKRVKRIAQLDPNRSEVLARDVGLVVTVITPFTAGVTDPITKYSVPLEDPVDFPGEHAIVSPRLGVAVLLRRPSKDISLPAELTSASSPCLSPNFVKNVERKDETNGISPASADDRRMRRGVGRCGIELCSRTCWTRALKTWTKSPKDTRFCGNARGRAEILASSSVQHGALSSLTMAR
eukprot:scaffold77948_cov32-Tisochrysis_lutea.AAC.2